MAPPLEKRFKKPPPMGNRRRPSKQHLQQKAEEVTDLDGEILCTCIEWCTCMYLYMYTFREGYKIELCVGVCVGVCACMCACACVCGFPRTKFKPVLNEILFMSIRASNSTHLFGLYNPTGWSTLFQVCWWKHYTCVCMYLCAHVYCVRVCMHMCVLHSIKFTYKEGF